MHDDPWLRFLRSFYDPYFEYPDGYRPAWERAGYTRADYEKAKAHWRAQPRHIVSSSPELLIRLKTQKIGRQIGLTPSRSNRYRCPTCSKVTDVIAGSEAPDWARGLGIAKDTRP